MSGQLNNWCYRIESLEHYKKVLSIIKRQGIKVHKHHYSIINIFPVVGVINGRLYRGKRFKRGVKALDIVLAADRLRRVKKAQRIDPVRFPKIARKYKSVDALAVELGYRYPSRLIYSGALERVLQGAERIAS